jgi:hypothetical protein
VAHLIPGRLRLALAAARGDVGFLSRAAAQVGEIPGVQWVSISPQAGSLVVHYQENEQTDIVGAVGDLGKRLQLFHLVREPGKHRIGAPKHLKSHGSELARELLAFATALDQELKQATDGILDLRMLLPAGAGALSAATRARQPAGPTPLWLTLAIFAFHSFVSLHRNVRSSTEELSIAAAAAAED